MDRLDVSQTQDWIRFQLWKSLDQNTQSNQTSSNETPFSETHNVPETQGTSAFSQVSLDDLLLSEGRKNMTELNPNRIDGTTWFSYDRTITKSVLQMIKSDLPNFSETYTTLPEDVKLRWFKSFAQDFNWNPTFTSLVRKEYDSVAKKVYSSQVCTWRRGWRNGKGPPECLKNRENIWNACITYWKTEKAEKISNKNKKNKDSQRGGDGKAVHTTGSKSYARRFDEMTQELGRPPNMVDFMIDTHTSKKTNTIIDKKAERIAESLKRKIDVMLDEETQDGSADSNSLSQAQMDTLYFKEIKGSRFGIGSLSVGKPSSSTPDLAMQEELLNAKLKIAQMEEAQVEQAKVQAEHVKAQAKQTKEYEHLKAMFLKHIPNSSGEFDIPSEDDN